MHKFQNRQSRLFPSRKTTAHRRQAATILVSGLSLLLSRSVANAQEPIGPNEPIFLSEPAEITSVVDAFDGPDAFDFNFGVTLQQTIKNADIARETHSTAPELSSGGFTSSALQVAKFNERTTRLNTRADIGLFRDLALVLRMPIILSNDRQLVEVGNSGSNTRGEVTGLDGERLFSVPFNSPTRSGVEYLALGLDFDLLNQWRDPTTPTWKFSLEGRFNVSEPMHACNETPASGQVKCADPSDIDRDGEPGELEGEGFSGSREAGVSRGTTGLAFQTVMSKRFAYLEPYAGLAGLFEFQNDDSDFGRSDLEGALVNHPPFEGTLLMGTAIMPWEELESFQRLEVDLRFSGTYRSQGRDYSELFDALGSSSAPSLREPKYSQYRAGGGDEPSVVDPDSDKVYTSGITEVQQHGIYTISTGVTWQGGELWKVNLGSSLTLVQGHLLTFDQPCNPNFSATAERAGPCRVSDANENANPTGIPNPNYREVINTPGRRFKVEGATIFDAWLSATIMF